MKVVLMHGKTFTPKSVWYPWFIENIKDRGIECIAPELPNTKDPHIEEWISEIDKTNPDENTVLVGHSRGGVAILRWLEQLPAIRRVRKVILVSVNSGSSKSMNKSQNSRGFYTPKGYNFSKIKSHCDDFVVFHSKDDPIVPFSAGEENAKNLNAKFLVYDNKGHFNLQEVPEILEEVLRGKIEK